MAIRCSSLLLGVMCLLSVQLAGADVAVGDDLNLPPSLGTAGDKQPVLKASGWTSYGPRQFMFFAIEKTWEEAESTCEEYGAHLASVHNENEDYFIRRLIYNQAGYNRPSWLGGYNSHMVPKRWYWTDESPFVFSPWTPGQPEGSGHCLQTNFKRGWDDLDCNSKIPFVCARLVMTGAYGDVKIGAQLPPSLGAGVTFGGGTKLVVSFGSAGDNQPVVGASGWSSFGSRQFKFFTIQNTWEQAESTCKQFDAHLASVHNKNENNFIMSLIHTQADGVWLGGHTDGDSGIWFWTDFSDFDHTNWSPGEPNGSGKCLKIYNNGLWDDFHCDRQLYFVCAR